MGTLNRKSKLLRLSAFTLFASAWLGASAWAESANCVPPFANNPRYNNQTQIEVNTQAFACHIIGMAQQNASPVDDFNSMCRLIAGTFDLGAVTESINSDLNGAFRLNTSQAAALMSAQLLNKQEFFREQREFRNQLDFIWVLNGGSRLERGRRGYTTRFLLRNARDADQTILYFNAQGQIVNLSNSGIPFGATLVGSLPDEIKNSNGGTGSINHTVVNDLLQRWLGARVSGCVGM